ncbi:MAG TPA: serine protease [Rhodocyclaceae bacterium]|nr:serine protease [Rhodocyclaceae bacterium]HUY02624.1 serine protease [Rhodocyclaceae bacterium]
MPRTLHSILRPGQLLAMGALLTMAILGRPALAGLPETIDRIKPSLVVIGTFQKTRSPAFKGLGTGFAVGDGTLVATNAHVAPTMTDPEETEVLTVLIRNANGTIQSRRARKVAADPEHDLALLKLNGPPLVPLQLGDRSADGIREGQAVAFSGFPILDVLGVFPTTSRGIISAIAPIAIPGADARELGEKQIRRLTRGSFDIYQLDATAYPGSSGSPLYEADSGMIIGIINMVLVKGTKENALSAPSGMTYAIPIRYLQDLLLTVR